MYLPIYLWLCFVAGQGGAKREDRYDAGRDAGRNVKMRRELEG